MSNRTHRSTAAVSELERRRDVAADALEDAARRAALGDEGASLDVERHSEAVAAYERSIAAAIIAGDRPYEGGTRSWWADLAARGLYRDRDAEARLKADQVDYRSTTGNYGALIVPDRLSVPVADSGQSRRPLADLTARPLAPTGSPVFVARVSTGSSATVQSAEGVQVTSQTDSSLVETSLPVVTIVELVDLSEQIVRRADPVNLDELIATEIVGAVDGKLEAQVVAGSGSSGEATGLLQTSNAGSYTLTGTTAADVLDAIARSAAASHAAAGAPADTLIMHPRRWAHLLAGRGDYAGAVVQSTTPGPIAGRVLGLDVVASLGVPATLGSSTNEDRILVCRRDDVYVAETPPMVEMQRDASGSGDALRARVRCYRYASVGYRKPTGLRIIAGAGLADPYP
jgi:HK97 family phage major capsid protein